MADGIQINTGTGPIVAAELIGTAALQRVKLAVGNVDTDGGDVSATNPIPVTGSLTAISLTTGTVNVVNVISASGVTIASVSTGTVNVVNTVAISGTVTALPIVSYQQGATSIAATGTGLLIMGIQGTTSFGIGVTGSNQMLVSVANNPTIASLTTGTVNVVNTVAISGTNTALQGGTWNIGTVTTLLGTVAVSGGGGGVQYGAGTTGMGSTATGTVVIGVQSGATTGRALAIDTTGGLIIASMPAVGGGQQYSVGGTNMGATGTGTLAIGLQTGATTGVALAVTTTGAQYVLFTATQAVTAANVTIASMTTGTVNVVNTVAISGSVTPIGTGNMVVVATAKGVAGGIVTTVHASQFQAFVLATTSAAGGVIVQTSGANTLYITDILVAASGPMAVGLYSETTGPLGQAFLATNGGWVQNLMQPYVCSSAQSLRVILSSSGTCAVSVIGYTVT